MPWVYFDDRKIALEAVEERGARAAQSLSCLGIGVGAVVAIMLRNDPAYIEALTAVRCLHGIRAAIPWHLLRNEMESLLSEVDPKLLIIHEDMTPRIDSWAAEHTNTAIAVVKTPEALIRAYELPPVPAYRNWKRYCSWENLVETAESALPVPAVAPQSLSITSGSTGKPKILRWSGRQRWAGWYKNRTVDRPPIKTSIVTAPLFHGAQYGLLSQAWRMRANLVIMPKFDPSEFLELVEKLKVSHCYAVPTMFVRLLRLPQKVRERFDTSSLNYVFHTGSSCARHIKQKMLEWWGPVIWEAYGCSETSTISVCSSTEWLSKPGTVGRPIRSIRIIDEDGGPCPPNQIGRVFIDVSGMPRLENAMIELRVSAEFEYISTGDMGYVDEDGYLYISGRTDQLMNTGRVKVYPTEIEDAILAHPEVTDCVVFPIPDEEFGQVIGAVIESTIPPNDIHDRLTVFLSQRLSEHKIPVRITASARPLRREHGKVIRQELELVRASAK